MRTLPHSVIPVFLLLIGAAGCQKPPKDQAAAAGSGSGKTVAGMAAGSGSGAGSAAAGQGSGAGSGSGSAAPVVEAKDIDSKDILARTDAAPEVSVKHVLLAWNG